MNADQVRVYKFRDDCESSQMYSGNFQLIRSRKLAGGSASSLKDNFHPQKSFCTRNKTQSLSPAKSYSNGKSDQCGRYGITTRRSGKNDGLKTNERNMKRQASKLVRNMRGLKGK